MTRSKEYRRQGWRWTITLAKITSKGQVTIPKDVREKLGVESGDALDFQFRESHVEVVPVRRRRLAEFRGLFRITEALDVAEERERSRAARAARLASVEKSI